MHDKELNYQSMTKMPVTKKREKSLNIDAPLHVSGRTQYLDDLPELQGTVFAKVYYSKIAHGSILRLDYSKAAEAPGVVRILSYRDIPGENEIGGIVQDEPLLAEEEVHFIGQPILLILAQTEVDAHKALALIEIEIEPKKVIVDSREAQRAGELLVPPRSLRLGDTETAFANCAYIFEGKTQTGGQEHVYLETQGAYAIPQGDGSLKIHSSTQGPTAVQRTVARVLGCSMNKIEVDVSRIGGGFGGKEDQASPWAALVALGAHIIQKPVKYVLERKEDLQMTGKRHPYQSDYKIGLDKDYKILAFEATYYQNGGAAADLSPAVLGRTLFHATNSYFIPNVDVRAYSCRTNLPPNTAFRGFGGPQGMFVVEAAIHHAARALGVEANLIQEKNLLYEGAEFSYGQLAKDCEAQNCWESAKQRYNFDQLKKEIAAFNADNEYVKKGLALMPVCFGISFTNTMMNNARALVHVYSDGSVGVSTGAVEMGQGVSSKMIQVAARCFGLSAEKIKLETTNTTRVANTSPSAASATADLNGKALQDACLQIRRRLEEELREKWRLNDKETIVFHNAQVYDSRKRYVVSWENLVHSAFSKRINLSAKGHYATPIIHFDREKGKGIPFAYHVYGVAIFTCALDCIRGTYDFESVKIVHDFGASMNRAVDLGQIEGGLVQGMGWMTLENLVYNEKGELKSNSLANYKIPDLHFAPKEILVHYLDTEGPEAAILKSKAVGEPPLMYGIGAYFCLYNAILAYNPKAKVPYSAPMTSEKILLALYS